MLLADAEIVIGWFFMMLLGSFGLGIVSFIMGFHCRRAGWTWLAVAIGTLLFGAPLAYLALMWIPLLSIRPPASLAPGESTMILIFVFLVNGASSSIPSA